MSIFSPHGASSPLIFAGHGNKYRWRNNSWEEIPHSYDLRLGSHDGTSHWGHRKICESPASKFMAFASHLRLILRDPWVSERRTSICKSLASKVASDHQISCKCCESVNYHVFEIYIYQPSNIGLSSIWQKITTCLLIILQSLFNSLLLQRTWLRPRSLIDDNFWGWGPKGYVFLSALDETT